jgi:hypothetical protein
LLETSDAARIRKGHNAYDLPLTGPSAVYIRKKIGQLSLSKTGIAYPKSLQGDGYASASSVRARLWKDGFQLFLEE